MGADTDDQDVVSSNPGTAPVAETRWIVSTFICCKNCCVKRPKIK